MAKSRISWTDEVWNPVTGCTKVSAGCKNCYAEAVAARFWKDGRKFTDVQVHADRLEQPLRWRRPRRVFVNSMSDLFHDDVPSAFIGRVFGVMALAARHQFQVLTKRPERMLRLLHPAVVGPLKGEASQYSWELARKMGMNVQPANKWEVRWPLQNVWLGISCEDQATADERVPLLLDTPAAVRFLSCEPLLSGVDLTRWLRPSRKFHLRADVQGMLRNKVFCGLTDESGIELGPAQAEERLRVLLASGVQFLRVGECDSFDPASGCPGHAQPKLDWVICGGESGPKHRPMDLEWARSLRDQCRAAGVPFFFKQASGLRPGGGVDALGEVVQEFPRTTKETTQ